MEKFDYNKCVAEHNGYAVTRDGRKVRLLCNDRKYYESNDSPIIALLGDKETVEEYTELGLVREKAPNESGDDLFTPSKRIKRTGWIHVYDKSFSPIFPTIESAKRNLCGTELAACVEVTIECFEGDGL